MTKAATYLDDLVAQKRRALADAKRRCPESEIRRLAARQPTALDFPRALHRESSDEPVRLIAEVKKASPSRGLLAPNLDPVALACAYAENGAAAISVLTEEPNFQGKLDYMLAIKQALGKPCPPLLRKDFIFDTYQVFEARAYGADALLLIASILTSDRLKQLIRVSHELGMEPLVEVHEDRDLFKALANGAKLIGINNRDLRTFKTDLAVTERLRPRVPDNKVVISESGILTREHVQRMRELRVDAVLVGEALVTASDVAAKVRELAS